MFAYTIRQFKFLVSQSSTPQKKILLSYCSPLSKYTFLNIQSAILGKALDETAHTLNSPQLTQFLSAVRNKLSMLKLLQESNYPYIDIERLHCNQKIENKQVHKYKDQIIETASFFGNLTDKIFQQANKDNFISWMQVCIQLQIIDIRIWSHLIKLAHQNYILLSIQSQQKVIKCLHSYLNSFFMKYSHKPNKFLYRQNTMIDIECLEQLITLFLKQFLRKGLSANQNELDQMFRIVVELIIRINHTVHIKLYKLQQHYKLNQVLYGHLLDKGSISTAVALLRYLSFLGVFNPAIINSIEERILKLLQNQQNISNEQRSSYALTILQIWSVFSHSNPKLYQILVRPILIQILNQTTQPAITTNIVYNMICSRIQEKQLIQKLISKQEQKYPIHNCSAHIITHYLSIINNQKRLSSYPHCIQNRVALEIAKRSAKIYSNCLTRELEDYPHRQNYRPHDITFQKQISKEVNPAEQFWLKITQLAFDQLNQRYPHPNNQIIFNFHFCAFQIDALIFINQQYIAFEFEGIHYKLKSEDGISSNGSKLIKDCILQTYGIKILQVSSNEEVVRTISSFNDKQNGAKYLLKRFEAIYSEGQRVGK